MPPKLRSKSFHKLDRKTIEAKRESLLTASKDLERKEIIRNSRKNVKLPKNDKKEEEPKKEEEIDLETIAAEYNDKELAEKRPFELVKMLKQKNTKKKLLGLYGLWKALGYDHSTSVIIKLFEKGILEDIEELWGTEPNFQFIMLKILTYMVNASIPKIRDQVDSKFKNLILELFEQEDTMVVCSAIFFILKLLKSEGSSRRGWKEPEIRQLIEKIMNVEEEGREKKENLLAVKYTVFNELISKISKNAWSDFVLPWIEFTSRILSIGVLRSKKNQDFEDWLIQDEKLLKELLTEKKTLEQLKGLCEKQGVCFFLLHIFQNIKKEMMELGFRKVFQKEIKQLPFTAM